MTPEQQRIAIAGECGYWFYKESTDINLRVYKGKPSDSHHEFLGLIGHNCCNPLPNYLTDLNAMHEAEKVLTDDQQIKVRWVLVQILDNWSVWQLHEFEILDVWEMSLQDINDCLRATASQRAEAFLRTLNLWTES